MSVQSDLFVSVFRAQLGAVLGVPVVENAFCANGASVAYDLQYKTAPNRFTMNLAGRATNPDFSITGFDTLTISWDEDAFTTQMDILINRVIQFLPQFTS